ncbi:MAG: hypothetical protein ACJAQT_000211 [Akkermansiaceae bacterium]|jgi:hypothetical protein
MSLPLFAEPQKPQAANVRFSVERGYHRGPLEIMHARVTPQATIIYTIDGTDHSKTNGLLISEKAEATVAVSQTKILRAIAMKDGLEPGQIGTLGKKRFAH